MASERSGQPVVVVVNDDPGQLAVLSSLLREDGISTIPCTGAEAALAAMDPVHPPSLIVTDLYMPGIDGWRFCRLLRSPEYAPFNSVPIVVISGTFTGEEPRRIAADLGVEVFLPYPLEAADLRQSVRSILGGGHPVRPLKVLIVDDSASITLTLQLAFASAGYAADTALSLQESVTLSRSHAYDIAVVDYHLPDGKGDTLLDRFRADHPDCVCLMMTTDPDPALALDWMRRGAAAYLRKPFEPAYLLELCARARRERALLRTQDLLERRTQDLRKSEQELGLALQVARMGYWRYHCDTHEVEWSRGHEALFGIPLEKFGGSLDAVQALVHPDDREYGERNLRKAVEEGIPFNNTYRVIHPGGDIRHLHSYGHVTRDESGKPLHVFGITRDITDQKRTEEALEKRMVALLQPLDAPTEIAFEDLFNTDDIQRLQDEFAEATGVASIITRPDGTPITQPSSFCRLCSTLIRGTEAGRANCFASDALIGRACLAGPTVQPCLSGGLWDAGAGITVGGRHVANWLIGQVRDETQTDSRIRAYARELGVDEGEMVAAFHEVPAMSRSRFERVARVLFTLANQLSGMAYQNMQQARFIAERERNDERIRASLREKEVLLREIHHRVKNNLQIITSLLNLQSQHVTDAVTRAVLTESQDRIRSMSLVHETLYRSEHLSRIDFAEHLSSVSSLLMRNYARPGVTCTVDGGTILLGIDEAIPCGLIVNELITNALRHGFNGREEGRIRVGIAAVEDRRARLTVADDGIGMPADLDWRNATSMGLTIVNLLTAQLEGTLHITRDGGTSVTVEFPFESPFA